jgi:hypothetical protein
MGWFSKKPAWEDTYAQNIYQAFVASDELGEMTPEKLRIPTAALQRYHDKALLQREMLSFVALMSSAGPENELRPRASGILPAAYQKHGSTRHFG